MTTTPAASAPLAGSARTLHLSELLRRPLTDRGGESIGKLSDVIVRLRGVEYPLVTGLVVSGPVMAQKKDCGELKSEIEAKIKKNGVEKFSLDVVDADKSAEGKVVGTCDGGAKKIVYKKG